MGSVSLSLTSSALFRYCLGRKLKGFYVTNVSQVPAALGIIADTIGNLYPHYKKRGVPNGKQLGVARWLLANYRRQFGVGDDATFDEQDFIIRNSYTGGSDNLKKSYENCQRYRDERCNEMCRKMLDYDRGDDFLQVGWVNGQSLLRAGQRVIRTIAGL